MSRLKKEVCVMSESQNIPGKRQAVISMILAVTAFLYYMLVPMYITVFFTLILSIIGLVQAIRAKRRGYYGIIRTVGLMLSIVDIAVSALMIAVLIPALFGAVGDL